MYSHQLNKIIRNKKQGITGFKPLCIIFKHIGRFPIFNEDIIEFIVLIMATGIPAVSLPPIGINLMTFTIYSTLSQFYIRSWPVFQQSKLAEGKV